MYFDAKIGRNFVRISVERCVLICHGLPYEPGSVVEKSYYELARKFSTKTAAAIFDFSGTGLSEGEFSLLDWREDLANLAEKFERVVLVGYSMGGAVAISAAAELKNVEKLVVVASPCCAEMFDERVLREIYYNAASKGLLRGIGSYESFRDRFVSDFLEIEPVKWIGRIRVPKLIVHGTKDDIVPFEHGLRLYREAREPKEFLEIDGDHFLRQRDDVTEKIIEWIEKS